MTKNTFTCPKFSITFTCKDDPVARIRTLRSQLTRNKISIFEYLRAWDIKHYELTCAWCKDHNHDIQFIEHEVINGEIHPTQVKRRYKAPYLCYSTENRCPSKKLNKNSAEFIIKAYGVSENDALKFIHERNKSPFYASNHTNSESHRLSQSRSKDWWEQQGKDRDAWIAKANYSRSMQGYIKKHGTQGEDLCANTQRQKAISLDKFIQEYGDPEGRARYSNWVQSSSHSLESYVKKYGKISGTERYIKKWIHFKSELAVQEDTLADVINRIAHIVSQNPLYEYQTFNVDKAMQYYVWYNIAKDYYHLSTEDVDAILLSKLITYKSKTRKIFNNGYSYFSYTNLGTILKSSLEILVYDYLIDLGLKEQQDFKINQRYPESNLFYDLYLIHQNTYIELAGNTVSDSYIEHMRFKEQNLSSIIVYPTSYQTQINQILGIQHGN